MDIVAILAIMAKAVTVIEALIEAGQTATPAIEALKGLIDGTQNQTITADQLTQAEALLDQQVADFNLPIDGTAPPASDPPPAPPAS